jgi:hypothetical protein
MAPMCSRLAFTFLAFITIGLPAFQVHAEFRAIKITAEQSADIRLHAIESDPDLQTLDYAAVRMTGDVAFPEPSTPTEVELLDFSIFFALASSV